MSDLGALMRDVMNSSPSKGGAANAENLTPDQMMSSILKDKSAKALRNARHKPTAAQDAQPVIDSMNPFQRFMVGVGHAMDSTWNGIQQPIRYIGTKIPESIQHIAHIHDSPSDYHRWQQRIANAEQLYQPLWNQSLSAKVGDFAGNVASSLPIGMGAGGLLAKSLPEATGVLGALRATGIGAGAGAAVGASNYGTPQQRVIGGVTGGLLGGAIPAVGATGKYALGEAKQLIRPFTQAGRERIAGQFLRDAAGTHGVPHNGPAPLGIRQTLGDATNNPGLLGLQKARMASRPTFGAQMNDIRNLNNEDILARANNLGAGGDSFAFPTAMRAKREQLANAVDTLGNVGRSPAEASAAGHEAIQKAFAEDKAHERALWDAVRNEGGSLHTPIQPINQALDQYVAQTPRAYLGDLPHEPINAIRKLAETSPQGVALPEIQAARSKALDVARSARASQEFNRARMAQDVANLLGDHLDNLHIQNPALAQKYATARDFTKSLHAMYDTNRAVSPMTQVTAAGAPKVEASQALARVARTPESVRAYLGATKSHPEAQSALSDYLVGTGSRQSNIAGWMAKNRDILQQVPEAQDTLRRLAKTKEALSAFDKSKLGAMVNGDPERVISSVLNGPNSAQEMEKLVTATQGNKDALLGLKRLVADHLANKMQTQGGLQANIPEKAMPALKALFKDPWERQLVDELPKAIRMADATRRAGYVGGSHTAELLNHSGAHQSVLLHLAGGKVGFLLHKVPGLDVYNSPRAQIQELIDKALTDHALGKMLTNRATDANLKLFEKHAATLGTVGGITGGLLGRGVAGFLTGS